MNKPDTIGSQLQLSRISRRSFLKFCALMASQLALPRGSAALLATNLGQATRLPVIWLSFQECTGCTESLTRSHAPSIEDLIFNYLSLDYHHTLQATSGKQAEDTRLETIKNYRGQFLLIVDGSIPVNDHGVYSTIAGQSNLDILKESASAAAGIVAVGSCAAFGGLPAAAPNPTGAKSVTELMTSGLIPLKPLINLSGCPPIPVTISSVLVHYLAFGEFPALDDRHRPLSFYGNTVHERCSRYHYYQEEKFAERFDDEGAKKGWCLYKLGCKGPITHNACSTSKWNEGTSSPVDAGHPCLGCSEPGFWDNDGFYRNLDDIRVPPPVAQETVSSESLLDEGRFLYEDNCVYCHSADPDSFSTSADKIPELLKSTSIRSHRRLLFSDDQLEALKQYIDASQGAQ